MLSSILFSHVSFSTPSTPATDAAAMLAKMSLVEKVALLHGEGNGYVGNTKEIVNTTSGVRIPPLNLNDGPQGFRGSGGSTCWPSGMTVGATWDVELAAAWGKAMGEEFYFKGSNVQLGPGLCVARVPRNGRNFEYLSGEDPFLGEIMAKPLIESIQSNGVIANAKHWVNNNQETNRRGDTAAVDERTRFEMYYPPFAGAIAGNVGSFMCSYNLIQAEGLNEKGDWSCENNATLRTDLKARFAGATEVPADYTAWVMSDWGATHSTSIMRGLDQEMPGGGKMGSPLIAAVESGQIPLSFVDDSVLRILTPMYKFGVFKNYAHWVNNSNHSKSSGSAANSKLARTIAAAATVLLKNDDNLLPIDVTKVKKIAIIGANGASGVTVHGGGSGQVAPEYIITPQQGITARYEGGPPSPGPPPTPAPANCTVLDTDTDYFAKPSAPIKGTLSPMDCCAKCYASSSQWLFFTHEPTGDCWCHASVGVKMRKKGYSSGSCRADPTPTDAHVVYDDGSDSDRAAKLAAAADIDLVLVFLGTSSSEGGDRSSLSFSDDQEKLVAAVAAAAGKKTAVIMFTPGAILTPWAKNVAAALTMHMPGLECGNALADVLFGDVNPTGRLSYTLPNKENEQGFTALQWPGVNAISVYSEKLEFGYRWYDAHKVDPAFPFGHGLSYTTFAYTSIKASSTEVSVIVTNSGSVAGAEVAQLYLTFPAATTGEPPLQLKGFVKTGILAGGAATTVTFKLRERELSIWDVTTHAWSKQPGAFTASVGTSSRDIRLTAQFTV